MQKICYSLLILLLVISSCKKDEEDKNLISYKLNGYAQKGPFVTGGKVTIIELDSNLTATGRTYTSTVKDDAGKLEFDNTKLASHYVLVKVNGQYYDEVDGTIPNDTLSLYSIVDVSTSLQINVNIFTHLVQARTKVLFATGISFADAKKQAEKELLKVFNLDSYSVGNSETLDLTSSNSDGGILLLLSAIIESNIGSGKTMTAYVADLQTDFKDNGNIDSESLQKYLATSAKVLDIDATKTYLKKRYTSIGTDVTLYDIKPLCKQFLNTTKYSSLFDGLFPSSVNDTLNLITNQDTLIIDKNAQYTIAINCPTNNAFSNVQVYLTSTSSSFAISSDAKFYTSTSNTQFLIKSMTNNTNLSIPISFTDSGQLSLQLRFVVKNSGIVYYPIKTIIWK